MCKKPSAEIETVFAAVNSATHLYKALITDRQAISLLAHSLTSCLFGFFGKILYALSYVYIFLDKQFFSSNHFYINVIKRLKLMWFSKTENRILFISGIFNYVYGLRACDFSKEHIT